MNRGHLGSANASFIMGFWWTMPVPIVALVYSQLDKANDQTKKLRMRWEQKWKYNEQ